MFTILSLVTSVKDYVEIVHKLIETDSSHGINNYYDFGAIITYLMIAGKQFILDVMSGQWLQNLASLPVLIPDIASSMVSEISVLDGYFHNAFTFLETPLSYGNQNIILYCVEKFTIGVINSLFLCLPTSTAYIICLRRFVMQGLEAGYIAGLGTIAGNVLWIGSVIFGLRFIVIPWLSLDILRYVLGFILLVKYMWESYTERRVVLEDISKWKIFLLNFLLAFTEQTNIYPFISNLSIGSDSTILESFPTDNIWEFVSIHGFYLIGILLGSLSLLQFTCWFWENPAFNLYMWMISSFKVTTSLYYKFLNFLFLYLTMICAISSVAYFGLDYTVTNPLGLVHEDRLVEDKSLIETAFLNSKASDRNTRRRRGFHGRNERWKRRVQKYRTFDASLYDQGIYDLFTIEDLNYGFDRFWLRRKMRNHRVRFRFFPGPWMRSFKKQLARPRLESFMGPRVEFFRILFEQVYHPEFHEFRNKQLKSESKSVNFSTKKNEQNQNFLTNEQRILKPVLANKNKIVSIYSDQVQKKTKMGLVKETSALRKFVRKMNTRIQTSKINFEITHPNLTKKKISNLQKPIYSKRWKQLFSKLSHHLENKKTRSQDNIWRRLYSEILLNKNEPPKDLKAFFIDRIDFNSDFQKGKHILKKEDVKKRLLQKDRQILKYKTFLSNVKPTLTTNIKQSDAFIEPFASTSMASPSVQNSENIYKPLTLLHPLKFYLQKEQAFQRKFKFYGVNVFRNFDIENNAPYFRIMMKKFFYYYKPTLRWERTMRDATMRKARRKGPRIVRKLNVNKETQALAKLSSFGLGENSSSSPSNEWTKFHWNKKTLGSQELELNKNQLQKPKHFYSLVSKRATRYRYQIFKDVLQHWYYTPFNRLLLKFDVDSFIRRQPSSYFLTKKEERLLHLKRFLLSEHYETLRWYTSMQHYRSMKTHIGGTKSFASRVYNQQFQGTFKKVRHLFAITPSLTNNNILKFDQALYNEFENNQNYSILNDSVIHEELLADDDIYGNDSFAPEDLTNQSAKVIREYLIQATPIRQELIKKLLMDKNYWELTQFLWKGQKVRGTQGITNQSNLLAQEQEYLHLPKNISYKTLFSEKKNPIHTSENESLYSQNSTLNINLNELRQNVWISLIQKCQKQLYNQESLKIYISGRVGKRERKKQKQKKSFEMRLKRLKNWYLSKNSDSDVLENPKTQKSNPGLTTALQKAIKEGILHQKELKPEKFNIRNNRPKISLPILLTSNPTNPLISGNFNKMAMLKNHLKNHTKLRTIRILKTEKDLRKSFQFIQHTILENEQNNVLSSKQVFNPVLQGLHRIKNSFSFLSHLIIQKVHLLSFTKMKRLFQSNPNKNLNDWRKREMALFQRHRGKTLKKLEKTGLTNKKTRDLGILNTNYLTQYNLTSNSSDLRETPLRQKRDYEKTEKPFSILQNHRRQKSWEKFQQNSNISGNFFQKIRNVFTRQFQRKVASFRRYRREPRHRYQIKRSKQPISKRLKRQIEILRKGGKHIDSQVFKTKVAEMITKRKYQPENEFQLLPLKQKKRYRGVWSNFWTRNQKKKQIYRNKKHKQRKRRRYTIGKLRVLNKKLKRIQENSEIKRWWWQTFLPNLQANRDILWQIEKDQKIQEQLSNLSVSEILKRDDFSTQNLIPKVSGEQILQIGNQDYKPLSIPQAIRLRENLIQQDMLSFGENNDNLLSIPKSEIKQENAFTSQNKNNDEFSKKTDSINAEHQNMLKISKTWNTLGQVSQNLLTESGSPNGLTNQDQSKFMVGVNPIPFYAGWDETLRKFVITNRFLSRKEAGYSFHFSNSHLANSKLKTNLTSPTFQFSEAPLQGMNIGTMVYWQVPFTTYDPEQFFALGQDGFSPLGWRRFHFKHSKQTTKPILVKTKTLAALNENFSLQSNFCKIENRNNLNKNQEKTFSILQNPNLSYNIQSKLLQNMQCFNSSNKTQSQNIRKNQSRRLQKRLKHVKKFRQLPSDHRTASGPLTNQILPSHYFFIFNKRARYPRDRYLRRLKRNKKIPTFSMKESISKITDFTLRKRTKPRRKYHRKRILRKDESLFLRRRRFRGFPTESERSRPISQIQLTYQPEQRSYKFKSKQRRKAAAGKQSSENVRIRQLRRRVQRQVLRPTPRSYYKPRAGGFVWPGDYLRLELRRAPKLNTNVLTNSQKQDLTSSSKQRKIRKKKRRAIEGLNIQPKKYLLEKHNLKVLKKRLEKSQNPYKIKAKIFDI
uniref:Hypothetical chloroplast protein RF1 n=1 Tax=Chromochloris zofingiensis TaxID=31302 RepID=A0A140HA90_9CHLO|nr:hypothetical chloroplast protein RF1 [Chromochloris zofingiensis]AMO01089.1 hypothetical chloroplast protein RF1 [Chromochloris zofingiensis]